MSIRTALALAPAGVASLLLSCLLLLAGGCNSARTEQFDIEVRNQTDQPLTLSLAKDGPPYEVAWATPEDLAIESPRRREDWENTPSGMSLLPPGKTASIRKLAGQFDPGTRGYLRVYAGDLSVSEMLARTIGSPNRVDVPLVPGFNDITIVTHEGHIKAKVDQPAPGSAR